MPARSASTIAAAPSVQTDRQSLRDELAHAEVALAQRDPEVPVRELPDVLQVLGEERLVQAVDALEVGTHRRRQGLLLVKGAARGKPQDEEGDGDDDDQRRNESGEAPEDVAQHGRAL